MLLLITLLLSAGLIWSAAAGPTLSATAIRSGKEVDTSALKFLPRLQRSRPRRAATSPAGDFWERPSGGIKRADVSYSENWCGISQHSPPTPPNPITSVYGLFSAPSLTIRPSEPIPQLAAAWVGIDGASCQGALLQAGTETIVNSNGGQSASMWWQWVPNASFSISGFPVKPGDWIAVNITTPSPTNAKIIMTNYDRDYSLTLLLDDGPKLCRQDADWIIENFYDAQGQVAFPRFSDVWFEDCIATRADGEGMSVGGAAMIYLGNDTKSATCLAEPYDDKNFYCRSQG